jgi:hypothetical protein
MIHLGLILPIVLLCVLMEPMFPKSTRRLFFGLDDHPPRVPLLLLLPLRHPQQRQLLVVLMEELMVAVESAVAGAVAAVAAVAAVQQRCGWVFSGLVCGATLLMTSGAVP